MSRGDDFIAAQRALAEDFIAAQRALAEDWGFDCYEAALRSWIATVAIVEVGYVGEWEEYTHELMARDYMSEIIRLSPSTRPKVEEDLAPWDERFRAATNRRGEAALANGKRRSGLVAVPQSAQVAKTRVRRDRRARA